MHVLIIPGEDLSEDNQFNSIFEVHQARALKASNLQIGFISVSVVESTFQFIKRTIFKGAFRGFLQEKMKKTRYQSIDHIPLIIREAKYLFPSFLGLGEFEKIEAGVRAYEAYVRQCGKPDLIHAHSRFLISVLIAEKIKKRYSVPFVFTEHSTFYANQQVSAKDYIKVKRVIDEAASWIVVSDQLGELISAELSNRKLSITKTPTIIPNILDPEIESEALASSRQKNTFFTYLNIAAFTEKKNHDLLIKSFSELLKTHPESILRLGGDGELLQNCKELAVQSGVQGSIEFLGKLDRKTVYEELRNADCFVLPSRIETFGVVLIEALAFGLPVIATRCGGPESIVNKNNGLLVKNNDENEFKRAMIKIIDCHDTFSAENIRTNCLSAYGQRAFVERITDLYAITLDLNRK